MVLWNEFFVHNPFSIKENEEHALEFDFHLSCLYSVLVNLSSSTGTIAFSQVHNHKSNSMFQNRPLMFQQDSAPVHKAKTTQQWFENHVSNLLVVTISRQPVQTLIHSNTNYGQFWRAWSVQYVTKIWSH